jgi:hypothetical protein
LLIFSRKRVGLPLAGAIERKIRAHIESATSQSISASLKHKLVTCLEVELWRMECDDIAFCEEDSQDWSSTPGCGEQTLANESSKLHHQPIPI